MLSDDCSRNRMVDMKFSHFVELFLVLHALSISLSILSLASVDPRREPVDPVWFRCTRLGIAESRWRISGIGYSAVPIDPVANSSAGTADPDDPRRLEAHVCWDHRIIASRNYYVIFIVANPPERDVRTGKVLMLRCELGTRNTELVGSFR